MPQAITENPLCTSKRERACVTLASASLSVVCCSGTGARVRLLLSCGCARDPCASPAACARSAAARDAASCRMLLSSLALSASGTWSWSNPEIVDLSVPDKLPGESTSTGVGAGMRRAALQPARSAALGTAGACGTRGGDALLCVGSCSLPGCGTCADAVRCSLLAWRTRGAATLDARACEVAAASLGAWSAPLAPPRIETWCQII